MEDNRNTVTREGLLVVKTFATRIAYVRETSIYKKLQGTGLAPKIVNMMDGVLEHEYVDGPTFAEALSASINDPEKVAVLISALSGWFAAFRKVMPFSLGGVRFDKFILGEGGLCYIDFEHCKPAPVEEDVAAVLAELCFSDEPFSDLSIEIASMFVSMSRNSLKWDPEVLTDILPKACTEACESHNFKGSGMEIRDLMWTISFEE